MLSAFAAAFTPFLERRFWSLPHKGWYLAAFLLPPALILMNVGGTYFTPVDGEGLAQLAGGMKLLRYDPSFGVFRVSYYSYMARQYLLNSLPSHFFGPSLLAARLGNSVLYLGSYLFFLSALASFLRKPQKPRRPFLFQLLRTVDRPRPIHPLKRPQVRADDHADRGHPVLPRRPPPVPGRARTLERPVAHLVVWVL